MGIWQWIKDVTVKVFWPWFKEVAWPFIRQHLKDIIVFVLDLFKEKLKKWMSQQAKDKEDRANQKAEDYEKKANASNDDREAEKFGDIAKVWREVAEQFRQENETLKRKIDELSREVKEEAFKKTNSLEIDLDFSDEKPILSIGHSTYSLPQLPSRDNNGKG
ncbi:hypothetical protein QUF90_14260 [Desulfococcaceae bacterium HSG9]|nr:hypothetical protein [Desulfococcaceae bacterium HSG9]